MRNYYRVMLGKGSMYADVCRQQGFIGAGFDINQDLKNSLPENWREFNKEFIPIFLEVNPSKSKIAAGLSCGALWTIAKGIQIGDIVLSPNGQGRYFVGEVTGQYRFVAGSDQPHQRPVTWYQQLLDKSDMSQSLRNSAGSIGTVSNVSKYRDELEKLIKGESVIPSLFSQDPTVEDATVFALEKHLEDFLVANWSSTPLGKTHDLYVTEESNGQQFPTDTGPIDLLAISKDKQELLVVELKRGRASDAVVGQIQRYMGYVKEDVAEDHQKVRGVIIALEDDKRIRRALQIAQGIDFYRYEVKFNLIKD
jgi:restriction system protein